MSSDALEPVRPIRALLRGLEALRALNARDGLTVTEVADRAKLPRTTAYRILETLRQGGFVIRDNMDDRYRPTMAVKDLAEGAQNEAWIHDGAWPLMSKLGRTLLWPLGIWTMNGCTITLRAATDRTSPLALSRLTSGAVADLYSSAPGLVMLAHESDARLGVIQEVAEDPRGQALATPRLPDIRAQGYSFDLHAAGGEIMMAVPVLGEGGRVLAALSVRFIRSALSDQRAIQELLPHLQTLAEGVSRGFAELAPASLKSAKLGFGGPHSAAST